MKRFVLCIALLCISPLWAEEVAVVVGGKELKGDLSLVDKKTTRVAFIVSGSGPTDRDGNTMGAPGKNNSLKYLSEHLNKAGVSTLRMDKRGVGASAGDLGKEADLRFSTYVKDVESWVNFLEKKGFSEVVLIGHSEGSLVATLAAKHKSVVGLVSIAGVGRKASVLLRDQLKPRLPEEMYKEADKVITSLEKGRTVKIFPPALSGLFRPSVQPYLISWFKVDPVKSVSDLKIPVLVVQGTTDLQISLRDAKLLHTGAENSKMKIIEGMNHVLKEVKGNMQEQLASYFLEDLPLHKDLGKVIEVFLEKIKVKE